MAVRRVAGHSVAAEISTILDSPEVASLVSELDALRWTGRKGYGARALVGACLVKALYAIPVWTRVAALIAEHEALQQVLGGSPSQWACYRFANKAPRAEAAHGRLPRPRCRIAPRATA